MSRGHCFPYNISNISLICKLMSETETKNILMVFVQLVFFFIIPLRYTYFVRENGFYSTEVLLSRKPSGIKQLNTMRIVLILTVFLTLISFIDFVLVTPIVGGYAPNNYSTGTVLFKIEISQLKKTFLFFQINSSFLCRCSTAI